MNVGVAKPSCVEYHDEEGGATSCVCFSSKLELSFNKTDVEDKDVCDEDGRCDLCSHSCFLDLYVPVCDVTMFCSELDVGKKEYCHELANSDIVWSHQIEEYHTAPPYLWVTGKDGALIPNPNRRK